MSSFERSLHRIRRDLDDLGRPWALVGALAVAARAEARATLDVDVALAVDGVEDAKDVVEALRDRGYLWQSSLGHAMTSLAVPQGPEAGLRLDLLFSLAGIEDLVALGAERIAVLPGLEMPVARLGDLIALKLLAAREPSREHDYRDLRHLIARAGSDDLDRARASLSTLARRGGAEPGILEAELDRIAAEGRG